MFFSALWCFWLLQSTLFKARASEFTAQVTVMVTNIGGLSRIKASKVRNIGQQHHLWSTIYHYTAKSLNTEKKYTLTLFLRYTCGATFWNTLIISTPVSLSITRKEQVRNEQYNLGTHRVSSSTTNVSLQTQSTIDNNPQTASYISNIHLNMTNHILGCWSSQIPA